jgi:hypothetical protein
VSLGFELGTMFFQLFAFVLVIAFWWLIVRLVLTFFRTVRRAADTLERVAASLERLEKKLEQQTQENA